MHGAVLAAVTPSNTPHGSNMTALFPTIIFIIQAVVLYVRFRRRPQAVPGHVALASSTWVTRRRGAVSAAAAAPAGSPAADETGPDDTAAEAPGESSGSPDSDGSGE